MRHRSRVVEKSLDELRRFEELKMKVKNLMKLRVCPKWLQGPEARRSPSLKGGATGSAEMT
jgi:hypothetical protein